MEDFNIDDLIAAAEHSYNGKGFSHKLPTGIPVLDIVLAGGYPLDGSMVELWGANSAGKTTLAYRICKKATEGGGYVTWVDSELSYDPEWAEVQGCNKKRIIAYRPPCLEDCFDTIIRDIKKYEDHFLPWINNKEWKPTEADKGRAIAAKYGSSVAQVKQYMTDNAPPHIIVWDSIAAAPARSEAEASGFDFSQGMAFRARINKLFTQRYQATVVGCTKVSLIIINQVIANIGSYGGGFDVPGGNGLKHAKHLSIQVTKQGASHSTETQTGFRSTDHCTFSITKNKVTACTTKIPIIFSKTRGWLGCTTIMEYLNNLKYFKNSRGWSSFEYESLNPETGEIKSETISFQGGRFTEKMRDRPELLRYLCNVVLQSLLKDFKSTSLSEMDMEPLIQACLNEDTTVLTDEEAAGINLEATYDESGIADAE